MKNFQISNFIQIRAVWAELFCMDKQTDGQTDVAILMVDFRAVSLQPKE
jgi:hypothetical protein